MINLSRKFTAGGVAAGLFVAVVGLASLRAYSQAGAGGTGIPATRSVRNPLNPQYLTPLMLASLNGDASSVRTLLARGADANEVNVHGTTPLMCAAANGHVNVLETLLRAGAQVNARSVFEQTPLLFAAKYGQASAAQVLISHGAEVNAERHRAITAQALEEIFGEEGGAAQEGIDAGKRSVAVVNAFAEALTNNHPNVAKLLLENGASPSVLGQSGANEALRLSARKGYAELVGPLLSKGAEVNYLDPRGRTALMEAATFGRGAAVEALLDRGAAVDVKDSQGLTALLLAAKSGNAASTRALLAHGAQIETTNGKGETALLIAARSGNGEAVDVLLKSGANRRAKDSEDNTAVMLAEYYGHASVAKRLGGKAVETGKWPN